MDADLISFFSTWYKALKANTKAKSGGCLEGGPCVGCLRQHIDAS